jgi:hypothetical protein
MVNRDTLGPCYFLPQMRFNGSLRVFLAMIGGLESRRVMLASAPASGRRILITTSRRTSGSEPADNALIG